jgi:hypothetical protein
VDLFPRYQAPDCRIGGIDLDSEPKLADEIKKMEEEPLLPVEKALIGWSIGLGIVLLCVLIWVSTFF